MAEQQYSGSCHCGKVSYDVKMDLQKQVIACNCSICKRTGTLLSFVPEEQFTLKSGEDVLTDYQFHKQVIHHLFCSVCGVRSFARGSQGGKVMFAINTRCLEGVEPEKLAVMHYDGASV
jgi:hypothetical protein